MSENSDISSFSPCSQAMLLSIGNFLIDLSSVSNGQSGYRYMQIIIFG
ncbi:hypothetical protein [Gluconobacter wancherniae]|nr:hypothetical protein [Gluconobacter wancherniae]MBF0853749.1 hypothetical protein [Gluconobacter wancherniae]MBS1063043.1 hypothetical protein [Gluconobacter wancherniae]